MKPHPAAEAFPSMTEREYAELKADIEAHGLRDPVEVYDGQILDGRHRFRACKELKQVPDVITKDDRDIGGDPFAYVVSVNLHRRHLTDPQRLSVAANIKRARGESTPAKPAAAKPESTERAVKVTDKGAAPVVKAVKAGKLSVAKAAKIVDAAPAKKDQAKLLKKVQEDDSFDPATLAPAPAKKVKPGTPVVKVKQRKECLVLLGKLVRALNAVGVYDEFIQPLSQIQERLEQI